MRNIRKFYIAFVIFTIICYNCANELKADENDDEINGRWRRHSKKSESESVKKQKQQQQQQQQQQEDSEELTRSQLARSPSYAVNTPIGLTTLQSNAEPMRNLLQNVPLQIDNPFNAGGVPSYAYNYPYPGQIVQGLPSLGQPGYLYGNPNMALNGGVQPLDQVNNNLIGQQPLSDFGNGQLPFQNGYATNFMGYGQPGLQQPGQQPYPPAYGNHLMGYNPFHPGQPGLQNNFATNGEQFNKPMTLPGFHHMFGQQGPLPGMPPMNGNNHMSSLTAEPSGAGHFPQPSILNPLLGMIPFGEPPQNGVNNGFGVPGGLFPGFIRNQRSLEDLNENE
ncbi:transcriptional corepressor SEUSS-like [Lucilia cuprina]|uniref:transcriptional corepressor SEUSS-like n=1 Tax=Lucilia cuprina TaxID=7375 RepID=UPI001F051D0A|nr:transcriptional corepressor SEUSS-like [Lucilia cuprina]